MCAEVCRASIFSLAVSCLASGDLPVHPEDRSLLGLAETPVVFWKGLNPGGAAPAFKHFSDIYSRCSSAPKEELCSESLFSGG